MRRTILTAVGIFLGTTATAGALDIQGIWEGRQSCRYFSGTTTVARFTESGMGIAQTGTTIDVDVDGATYRGTVIENSLYPSRGEAGLTACLSSGADEMVRARIAGDRFKAVSILRTSAEVALCRWTYRRTGTSAPPVVPCL